MSLVNALNLLRPSLPYYMAVAKYDLLHLGKNSFEYRPNRAAPSLALEMVQTVMAMGASSCIESFVMSRMLTEGPKVFSFDAVTCEALENFDLNVSTADYMQPFPSVVIELPQDYTKKRIVPFDSGNHAPDFVIVRHEPKAECVLVTIHMTSHQAMTRLLMLDPTWTLEEMWTKGQRTWNAKDSMAMTEEERGLGSTLSKLALNVCLIATAYGVRNLGPANPSHYERLKKYAKLARKRGQEQQAKADMELRLAPVKYAFALEVTLFLREFGSPSESNGNGGWTVSPHWRRGQWRWQACGTGRQERRRVAIPSVLVNSHLFLGSAAADSTARYRVGGSMRQGGQRLDASWIDNKEQLHTSIDEIIGATFRMKRSSPLRQ